MSGRSYSIVGTGALGGYYGARLHHAGCRVSFLLNSDYDHVLAHGLRVESVDGDFSISSPPAYGHAGELPAADVVVVSLKTTSNHLLPALLPAAARDGCTVLMMQNGLGVEAEAEQAAPGRTVLGGLAFLCSNKVGPGHIRHLDYGAVRLGQHGADGCGAAGITETMRAVAEDFERAGIHVTLEEDLVSARWKKLVWNVPYNGLCVVHDCTTDVLMGNPSTRALCKAIMDEVLAAAEACGHPIDASFADKMMRDTDAMARYMPSMKLDFDRGRPLEIDAIYARPLSAASAAGLSCPQIEALYARLLELDPGRRD